jgi:hypothetical protein
MKKLLIVFTILSFTSCIAQKTLKMEQEVIIPEINKKFETFDIQDFNKKVDNVSGVRRIKKDEILIEEDYQNPGFSRITYFFDSNFYLLKLFFENGNIKEKGISFNNGSEFGVWYHYNEKGSLIKEENTDIGYDFGWLDVIKYCHKNDIQLEKGYPKRGGIKTEIYKNEEEGKKVWIISYYKPKTDEYIEVTLDGKTGKEIKRRDLEFIGN